MIVQAYVFTCDRCGAHKVCPVPTMDDWREFRLQTGGEEPTVKLLCGACTSTLNSAWAALTCDANRRDSEVEWLTTT